MFEKKLGEIRPNQLLHMVLDLLWMRYMTL